jgi:hypothetical protein
MIHSFTVFRGVAMKEQDAEEYFREMKSELLHRRRRRKAFLLVIAGLCLSFALSGGAGSYYFGIFRMPSDLMLLIAFVLLVLFFWVGDILLFARWYFSC